MANLLCQLLTIYIFVLFGRIILSWFPISSGSAMATVQDVAVTVTEPVLGPLRRVLPPLGGFDLSPIVVLFGIQIIQRVVLGC